jgi:hypothetical protein
MSKQHENLKEIITEETLILEKQKSFYPSQYSIIKINT